MTNLLEVVKVSDLRDGPEADSQLRELCQDDVIDAMTEILLMRKVESATLPSGAAHKKTKALHDKHKKAGIPLPPYKNLRHCKYELDENNVLVHKDTGNPFIKSTKLKPSVQVFLEGRPTSPTSVFGVLQHVEETYTVGDGAVEALFFEPENLSLVPAASSDTATNGIGQKQSTNGSDDATNGSENVNEPTELDYQMLAQLDAETARQKAAQDAETARHKASQDAETARQKAAQDAETARQKNLQDAETARQKNLQEEAAKREAELRAQLDAARSQVNQQQTDRIKELEAQLAAEKANNAKQQNSSDSGTLNEILGNTKTLLVDSRQIQSGVNAMTAKKAAPPPRARDDGMPGMPGPKNLFDSTPASKTTKINLDQAKATAATFDEFVSDPLYLGNTIGNASRALALHLGKASLGELSPDSVEKLSKCEQALCKVAGMDASFLSRPTMILSGLSRLSQSLSAANAFKECGTSILALKEPNKAVSCCLWFQQPDDELFDSLVPEALGLNSVLRGLTIDFVSKRKARLLLAGVDNSSVGALASTLLAEVVASLEGIRSVVVPAFDGNPQATECCMDAASIERFVQRQQSTLESLGFEKAIFGKEHEKALSLLRSGQLVLDDCLFQGHLWEFVNGRIRVLENAVGMDVDDIQPAINKLFAEKKKGNDGFQKKEAIDAIVPANVSIIFDMVRDMITDNVTNHRTIVVDAGFNLAQHHLGSLGALSKAATEVYAISDPDPESVDSIGFFYVSENGINEACEFDNLSPKAFKGLYKAPFFLQLEEGDLSLEVCVENVSDMTACVTGLVSKSVLHLPGLTEIEFQAMAAVSHTPSFIVKNKALRKLGEKEGLEEMGFSNFQLLDDHQMALTGSNSRLSFDQCRLESRGMFLFQDGKKLNLKFKDVQDPGMLGNLATAIEKGNVSSVEMVVTNGAVALGDLDDIWSLSRCVRAARIKGLPDKLQQQEGLGQWCLPDGPNGRGGVIDWDAVKVKRAVEALVAAAQNEDEYSVLCHDRAKRNKIAIEAHQQSAAPSIQPASIPSSGDLTLKKAAAPSKCATSTNPSGVKTAMDATRQAVGAPSIQDDADEQVSVEMETDATGVERPKWFPRTKAGNFCKRCKYNRDTQKLSHGSCPYPDHWEHAITNGYNP